MNKSRKIDSLRGKKNNFSNYQPQSLDYWLNESIELTGQNIENWKGVRQAIDARFKITKFIFVINLLLVTFLVIVPVTSIQFFDHDEHV